MKLTQGHFSFLPELTDTEIGKQIEYALDQGWAVAVEYTDDPHPRNTYWAMWGHPMFDLRDPAGVMVEVEACRRLVTAKDYIRVLAFDCKQRLGDRCAWAFMVNRPSTSPASS